MKILLVNKFHYKRGGAETYYFSLAKALIDRGHEVIFFSMKDEQNFPCDQEAFFVENVDYNKKHSLNKLIKMGVKLIYSFEAKSNLEKLILKEKPDIAHLNGIHRQLTLSVIDILHKYNIPIVYTAHDLMCVAPCYTMSSSDGICEKCLYGNYINCAKNVCIKNSKSKSVLATLESYFNRLRNVYNKVDLYITPSNFHRNKFLESSFTTSDIIHLKNFLPPETIYEISNNRDSYILFFGRISKEKGILTLIKAVKMIQKDIKLKIVGEGPQKNEIEKYIIENGLESKIDLLGFKSGEELDNLIRNSKCVVTPSECNENCPYSIMEAMSKGIPVIASDIGGIPELVEDNVTGYLFKPFDELDLKNKIDKLLSNSDLEYFEISKSALNKARDEFNYDSYIDKIILEYKKLVV